MNHKELKLKGSVEDAMRTKRSRSRLEAAAAQPCAKISGGVDARHQSANQKLGEPGSIEH